MTRTSALRSSLWPVFAIPLLLGAAYLGVEGSSARLEGAHKGPAVAAGESGPMRFVPALHEGFDLERVMETVAFADQYYRSPANDGYDAVMAHIEAHLRELGFGSEEGFELDVVESEMEHPAWTPISASLALVVPDGEPRVLHSLEHSEDRDRVMLLEHCPSAKVSGEAVLALDEVIHGKILLTEAPISPFLLRRARMRGAAAVISGSLNSFNVDPSGAERHLDAIQYKKVPPGTKLPVCQVSQRTFKELVAHHEQHGKIELEFESHVRFDRRPLRTLIATVVGTKEPDEAVPIVSHVQEPGACDNASGLAGLLESARAYKTAIQDGALSRPARSIAFVWGHEFQQSEAWLEHSKRTAVAAISSDMTGENSSKTGAIALLERMPDPGALIPLEPDFHTPWGAGEVDPESLVPNGFSIMARCALLDVSAHEGSTWKTGDHPWEGGSDHDTFIESGVPAVLFWHFTDFTYHSSLDRMEFVDPSEMRRTGVAILATALCMADPRRVDLDRYLRSVEIEKEVRMAAAREAGDPELARRWKSWCLGASSWLRRECVR